MQECAVDHPGLPALFDPAVPDNPVLWSVLKGRHAGRALVDDTQQPSQCVLRTEAVLTFSSRQVSQTFLNDAIAYFRQAGAVWLVWPDTLASRLIAPENAITAPRLAFMDYDPLSDTLVDLRRSLPEGFEIQLIDRQILERCEWRAEMEFYCGSFDNFLLNDLGLCMVRGDEIIVEAYASSLGEPYAEIGAITHKMYRGRGYAPIACAYLIEALEQRGYHAYWSCDIDNPASIRVARKLGFQQEKAYQILEYGPLRDQTQ